MPTPCGRARTTPQRHVIGCTLTKHTTMRNFITPLFLSTALLAGAQQSHTIVANDFTFTPDLLTVAPGDTIWLALGAGHSFTEVTGAAWQANESTPVGFFDIGPFPQADDSHYIILDVNTDTLYYVCVPHIAMGMKGRIVVDETAIGLAENAAIRELRLVPEGRDLRLWNIWPGALARAVDMAGRSHPLLITGSLLHTAHLPPGTLVVEVAQPDGTPVLTQRVVLQ